MFGKIDPFFPKVWKTGARVSWRLVPPALMFLLAFTPGVSFMEDLGRHLLLGRVILETGRVPATNLLTYTWPDHPFINHHWLSEVVFHLVHRAAGLNGLIVLKAALMAGALALAMASVAPRRISARHGLAAVLAAVVLGFRAHVRPELFTFLGVAFYLWGFERLRRAAAGERGGARKGRLAIAAAILLYGWFWANAHIYFIFGLGMAGAFFIERWWARRREGRSLLRAWPWPEAVGVAALAGVSLLNPNGWRGLVYPLTIFRQYGLAVTENASPLELWRSVLNPMLIVLPLLTVLSAAALAASWRRASSEPVRLAHAIILAAALVAAWRMARSAPLLALAALPAVGAWARGAARGRRAARAAGAAAVLGLAAWLAAGVVEGWYVRAFPAPVGPSPFGLDDEARYLALRRLREDGLPGRVFSDYNVGSLVEYNLYPEPAYVDNRPEAFPPSFWSEEYFPALALGPDWERIRAARGIRTVAVSLPGVGPGYVGEMMGRPEWRLVHLDYLLAVWVLAEEKNAAFIERNLFTRRRLEAFCSRLAERIEGLPAAPFWRRQVLAEQCVYELYALACVGEMERLRPMLWSLHRLYPDYRLLDDLLRAGAPPEETRAVNDLLVRRARRPLAFRQVLDGVAVLEAEGRFEEARAVYRRGRRLFPLAVTPDNTGRAGGPDRR